MSRRCVGYEGEGRSRRPVYVDEGPASVAIADRVHELGVTPRAADVLPTGGAGEIEISRVEVDEATQSAARAARTNGAPGFHGVRVPLEHTQASRQRGAQRRMEVVAARKPAADHPWKSGMPAQEETVSEHAADREDPEPVAADGTLARLDRLQQRTRAATEAWEGLVIARATVETAEARWDEARELLERAWADAGFAAAVPAPVAEEPAAARPKRTAARSAEIAPSKAEQPVTPKRELTSHERRILAATIAHKGDRKAVAKELGLKFDQSVDQALQKVGEKGQLPIDLIPQLPARFARYQGV